MLTPEQIAAFERERISLTERGADGWFADLRGVSPIMGSTPLIAAMRAYVASKFGQEVDLPCEGKAGPVSMRLYALRGAARRTLAALFGQGFSPDLHQRSPYWPGCEQLKDCRSAHSARASAAWRSAASASSPASRTPSPSTSPRARARSSLLGAAVPPAAPPPAA